MDVRDRAPPQQCYVCHENIELWLDPLDEGEGEGGGEVNARALGPIEHPDVRRAFASYDRDARLYVPPPAAVGR